MNGSHSKSQHLKPTTGHQRQPFHSRIGTRLFVSGAILVLLTGLIVALMSAAIARQGVLAEAERRVLALVEQREAHLRDWLDAYFDTAIRLTRSLYMSHDAIDADHYRVLTSMPGVLEATVMNGLTQSWVSGNSTLWVPDSLVVAAAEASGKATFGSVQLSEQGIPVFDIVLPLALADRQEKTLLALRLDSRLVLDPVLTDTSGLGESGELFLLDSEMRMLTPSRFHSHPDPLNHTMDIPPAQSALTAAKGTMIYTSFLGEPVVGGYVYMPEYDWILVGELDLNEALAPVTRIYERSAIILGLSLVALLIVTLVLARSWARPIVRLTDASEQLSAGDYDVQVQVPRKKDELHRLTNSFNRLADTLRTGREELAHAQRRLVKQETMAAIGGLVSSVVHEIRNPLSSIKMNLRLIERQCGKHEAATEHFSLARQEAFRLETMLGELLDYGKPIEPALAPSNINEVVRNTVEHWMNDSHTEAVEFQLNLNAPDPIAAIDSELLRRTLDNLIQNAVESMPEGGLIRLTTRIESTGKAAIAIQDTGKGMSEPIVDRVFDPFFTTRDKGTGLGMANVKRFVELNEGSIHIQSFEDEGTTVTVLLPGGSI